jgi:hypothetical protein
MKITGPLSKMITTHSSPVKYELMLGEVRFDLTSVMGKTLRLNFSGRILCQNCGKKTKKSYSQGYCFPCTMKLAETDLCILKPETCHYSKGTCRDPKWGEENCFKPHIVYLANSSGLKVGITRATQVPTRWMDQGATAALPIMEVPNRFISGQVEMLFKKLISDKTDWRKMLKGEPEEIDLKSERDQLLKELGEELKAFEHRLLEAEVYRFNYPISAYPEKINSFNLDKVAEISSRLMGVKGQYLIFESGVLNVRSHSGYEVTIEGEDGPQDNQSLGLQIVGVSR